jgi:coenzyme F420-reducing hydrogenase delta subunit
MPVLKALLTFTGIEPERFLAKWVSASEGELFAETVREFTEALRGLPPMREVLENAEPRLVLSKA